MGLIDSTADLLEFLRTGLPEKQAEFDRAVTELGVQFVLDEDSEMVVFKANSEKNQITVGQRGMERLWAHAYAYSGAFHAIPQKLREQAPGRAGPSLELILDQCSRLLTWAVRADVNLKLDKQFQPPERPSGLLSPFDPCEDGTVQATAQALWCFALAFIFFHELSHVQMRHVRQKGAPNVEQEKDADREAARWLLEHTEGSERRQLERRLGVGTALIYLATYDVYLPGGHGESYPPGYDRLFQTLCRFLDDEDEEQSEQVWAFVAVALMLHLHNKRIPLDGQRISGPWRGVADYLVEVLSRM
jgi:Peptidase U49